ncbi:unnamed protein product, partial [Didymodactylos carnosus]
TTSVSTWNNVYLMNLNRPLSLTLMQSINETFPLLNELCIEHFAELDDDLLTNKELIMPKIHTIQIECASINYDVRNIKCFLQLSSNLRTLIILNNFLYKLLNDIELHSVFNRIQYLNIIDTFDLNYLHKLLICFTSVKTLKLQLNRNDPIVKSIKQIIVFMKYLENLNVRLLPIIDDTMKNLIQEEILNVSELQIFKLDLQPDYFNFWK